jgi:hypothetical protein
MASSEDASSFRVHSEVGEKNPQLTQLTLIKYFEHLKKKNPPTKESKAPSRGEQGPIT